MVVLLITIISLWGARVIKEGLKGLHVSLVQKTFQLGMVLFIVSEAMLFFPFFWSFFHASLAPSIEIGGVWPPVGIDEEVLNPFLLPLVNTIVLLSSGVSIVSAHRSLVAGFQTIAINSMYITIMFGILFSWLQFLEYGLTKFAIIDGIYGSVFFMLTGLHGFHVVVGTILLCIVYWRLINHQFSTSQHIGFETAAWYWHFVDVIWLGVFSFIYVW